MTMAACYTSYDVSISHGITAGSASSQQQQNVSQISQPLQQQLQSSVAAATALVTVTAAAAASTLAAAANSNLNNQKDYSIPLHVDCSVEYELPNQPKPPAGQRVEPLLMIHPCYFRKMESQRRSPFVNNMPNSSRNSAALLGVSSTAQSSNIAQSTSISSTRRTSVRHQQQSQVPHHHHNRQTSIAQYGSTLHHHSLQQQQQQQIRPSQSNPQQQMSQMSQKAHYPSVSVTSSALTAASGQYIERASAIRRATGTTVHRDHQHSRAPTSSIQQQQKHPQQHQRQNHQNLLVQSSSSSSVPTHWDQLAAVATIITSIAPHSSNILPPVPHISLLNQCTMKCSTTNSSVGKRDALISGGYATRSTNTTLSSNEPIRIDNNRTSSGKLRSSQSGYGISTSLVDTTNLRWNTAASLMVDRSPIATVPSNYQAGPDATPTQLHNTLNNDNKNDSIETSGKYRQYLRSHRIHPYLPTLSAAKLSAIPSAVSASHIGPSVPQFSEAASAAAAFAATPSFQQHLQQISCYNV